LLKIIIPLEKGKDLIETGEKRWSEWPKQVSNLESNF